jgi:hypothetical protein
METETMQSTMYEQKLVGIARRLTPERASELLDFAQFLEFQLAKTHSIETLEEDASEADIAAENAQWDTLLATEESQRLLEKMADEAWAQIQAGQAKPMIFTEDGEIAFG